MLRANRFAVGLTLLFLAFAVFRWMNSAVPQYYLVGSAVIGVVLVFPGALLLGMAFWPPDDKRE